MPDNYKLVPTKNFLKSFDKLDFQTGERVLQTLENLKKDPYQGKKLTNKDFGKWRIRVGDYRIRYDIEGDAIVLNVVKHRKDIYRSD